MNKIRRYKTILVMIAIAMIIIGIVAWLKYGDFVGYWNEIGHNRAEVEKKFGVPYEEILDEYYTTEMYEGLKIKYINGPNNTVYVAEITNEDIHFGLFRIGVGSPRWLVESVYCLKKQMMPAELNAYCVTDNVNCLEFLYDENERVEKIYFSFGI